MIVVVALSPCVDRTMVVDRLIIGEVHRPSIATVTPGGKGFNVARAAHTLGAPVVAVGIVGGHAGNWLRSTLTELGVGHDLIWGANETRTSVSIADLSSGIMTDVYEPATAVTEPEWAELEVRVASLAGPGDWVSISGTLPTGAPVDAVSRLIRLARGRGARVAVDTHGAALRDAATAHPDVIKINLHEARGLADCRGVPPTELVGHPCIVAAADLTIITAGVDGAYTRDAHAMSGARGMYPVGSGDSFMAGLLTDLVDPPNKGDLATNHDPAAMHAALVTAVAAATANALVPGAASFDPGDVARLRRSIVITPVDRSATPTHRKP